MLTPKQTKIMEEIRNGNNHLYGIAKVLNTRLSNVQSVLRVLEAKNLIERTETEEVNGRQRIIYRCCE